MFFNFFIVIEVLCLKHIFDFTNIIDISIEYMTLTSDWILTTSILTIAPHPHVVSPPVSSASNSTMTVSL